MLVLTRSAGESIRIGPDVEVAILATGGKVKVGIEAPETIRIVRSELLEQASHVSKVTLKTRGEKSAGTRQTSHAQCGARKSKLAILLVEDDPIHAQIISRILSNSTGADIAVVATGEEAVERLWRNGGFDRRPNLILLDLRLPGMNGLEVLVRIKSEQQLRRTPVVVLSSSEDRIEMDRCLDAGANAYVTKSANHAEFRTSLNRIAGFWGQELPASDVELN